MRTAEAYVTFGVVAAREGDIEGSLDLGRKAIGGSRKSLPSLAMHVRELGVTLAQKYPNDRKLAQYVTELRQVVS